MTLAVVAHPGDQVAIQVAGALERRLGTGSVILAWAEELMVAQIWRHRVGGSVETDIVLRDGRALRSNALAGVFCRLRYAPAPLFTRSGAQDREYAAAEGYALLLSWLAGLPCPVVNRAGPLGLSGPQLTLVQWLTLGAQCGLRTRAMRFVSGGEPWMETLDGPPQEVHVVGGRVLGAVPRVTAEACLALGRETGCPVLGVHLAPVRSKTEPVLCAVDTAPRLSDEGVQAVADLLAT